MRLTLARKLEAVHITTVASRKMIPIVWRHTPPNGLWLFWLVVSRVCCERDESLDLLRASLSSASCKVGTGRTKPSAGTWGTGPLIAPTGFPRLINLVYGGAFALLTLPPLLHRCAPYVLPCEGAFAAKVEDRDHMQCYQMPRRLLVVSRWGIVLGSPRRIWLPRLIWRTCALTVET